MKKAHANKDFVHIVERHEHETYSMVIFEIPSISLEALKLPAYSTSKFTKTSGTNNHSWVKPIIRKSHSCSFAIEELMKLLEYELTDQNFFPF